MISKVKCVDVSLFKEHRDTLIGVTLRCTDGGGPPEVVEIDPPPVLAHGVLRVGDVILSINGWKCDRKAFHNHIETTARLKRLQGKVSMKVVRVHESEREDHEDDDAKPRVLDQFVNIS